MRVVFLKGQSEYEYHASPEKFNVHAGCAPKYVGPSVIHLI